MKVRLKLEKSENEARGSAFQFHEGPIKTGEFLKSFVPSLLFQFHEGPIKTGGGKFDFEVREQFQFHEGPIKTHCIFQ